jgi:hypothetical protein
MSISQNLFTIITTFIVIGGIIYFFYNASSNKTVVEKYAVILNQPPKRVRFDENVTCNYYTKHPNEIQKKMSEKNNDEKILDKIISNSQNTPQNPVNIPHTYYPEQKKVNLDKIQSVGVVKEDVYYNQRDKNILSQINSDSIIPSNLDLSTMGDSWDANFGMPLMSKKEQGDYFARMMDNHKKYDKSVGEFFEYVTDQKAVLKTDTTIDPFKPSTKSNTLKNKAVSEIYNEQVAGPQAVPKKIKRVTDNETYYDDETAMNGGKITGSNLFGMDEYSHQFETATFGNGF